MLGVKPSFRTGFAQYLGMSEYPQLWKNLEGAWDMSLGATGRQLLDFSGNGNTGTISGATWQSNFLGSSLLFSAGTNIITFASDPIGTDACSLWMWIYPTSFPLYPFLAFNDAMWFYIDHTDSNKLWFSSNGSDFAANKPIITANALHMVGFTRTAAGVANVYLDGVLSGSADFDSGTPVPAQDTFVVGNHHDFNRDFIGGIVEIGVAKRVLSASEMNLLYQLRKRLA